MLIRTISGAVYVLIVTGFFLLREFVTPELFQILIWFFSCVGTFEVARAVKSRTVKGNFTLAIVFGIIFPILYCLFEYVLFKGFGYFIAIDVMLLFVIITAITCLIKGETVKTFIVSALPFLYPAVFILTMMLANDLNKGFIAMLLIFAISPLADVFAYLVGSTLKGPKFCPKLSPKKTWSGMIGGIIGGIIGSLVVYFIFRPEVNFFSPVLLFVIIGIFGAILTEAGDLFESFIKRKVGIKDMGKIMPGHGGVMDRIDGMSFCSAFILLIFALV